MVVRMVVGMVVLVIRRWRLVDDRCLAAAQSHHRSRRHEQSSPALHSTHRSLSRNRPWGLNGQMRKLTASGYGVCFDFASVGGAGSRGW
jgi:hypothetical protein